MFWYQVRSRNSSDSETVDLPQYSAQLVTQSCRSASYADSSGAGGATSSSDSPSRVRVTAATKSDVAPRRRSSGCGSASVPYQDVRSYVLRSHVDSKLSTMLAPLPRVWASDPVGSSSWKENARPSARDAAVTESRSGTSPAMVRSFASSAMVGAPTSASAGPSGSGSSRTRMNGDGTGSPARPRHLSQSRSSDWSTNTSRFTRAPAWCRDTVQTPVAMSRACPSTLVSRVENPSTRLPQGYGRGYGFR